MRPQPKQEQIDDWVQRSLAEDLGPGDITTDALVDPTVFGRARIVAKQDMVLCGVDIARTVFTHLDRGMTCSEERDDGSLLAEGDVLLAVAGKASALLKGERTALNILQRLSGIATLTHAFVEKAGPVQILDTRKTTPGLRVFEKYAVACGGGINHRFGLFDAVLIKDNHIKMAGGIAAALERMQAARPPGLIEIEATNLEEVEAAVEGGADVILLDNMSSDLIAKAVTFVDRRARTEASGMMTLERVAELAGLGLDCISVGALTHSAPAVDISMNFDLPG
ncbi:carboxylating nicotinate-nucleotide diphosphorylase [Nitrospina watsonii]|uniref:nicotinate-nucleotide diphosphorylase (carboxylating) n=1 Tax=Nitrospina watsonii TaxID=1323948 RepID=A0ABN8W0T6_9BACT|nr:carboxylating nicotinate-nucleotide diphosphorylase [Nitrospina watsonii]CAI2718351.1 putative nicotinate-nucleotide pyrophosphorylase [carboxylating] [Nitrospina watsonii]